MNNQSASFVETGRSLVNRRGVTGRGFGLLADILLIGILAFGAAHLIWTILSPTAFVKLSTTSQSASGAQQASRLISNPQIFARFDPFNRDLSASKADVSEDAPQTRLNLIIRSLIASTDPATASVRIEMPDGTDRRFQEGDSIISGVTLERILSDRVVLLRRGEREVLLAREKRVLDIVREDGQPVIDPTPDTKITNTPVQQVAVSDLNISSFDELMSRVQLRRKASDDGSQPELVVFSSSDAATLQSLGLQVDDSLLSVNGFDLRDESLSDLAGRLRNEKQLSFTLKRQGETLTRTIKIGNSGK